MNGYQRIQAALRGEWPDTTPIMLHNFMMAAHEAGISMRVFRSDPCQLAAAFIQAVERYAYDGIVLDVDTVTLAGALGVPIDFPEHEPARARGSLLQSLNDLESFTYEDILGYPGISVWLEAARILRRTFGNQLFLRGNCDQSPFTLASLLRGIDGWLMDLTDPAREAQANSLLEHCTEVTCTFIRAMAATGVHMVSNGDSVAGPEVVSPSLYRRFAFPSEQRVAECAHERAAPYVLHICGNTGSILADMLSTGADGLEIDYKTDLDLAHTLMKDRAVFIGNLDPSGVLARGSTDLVARRTRQLLSTFADTPRFILNAGCAIPSTTPPENLRTMIAVAREFHP
jgi:MtaA/CmuA family methyltransferase